MKNIKGFITLFISLVFCVGALSACGGSGGAAASEAATESVTEAATEAPTEAATEAVTEAAAEDTLSGELVVYAAASMTESLGEAIEIFKTLHPNVEVTANYGSSGDLVKQIIEGGVCDVFISAANKQMNQIDATKDAEANPDGNDLVVQGTRVALLENKCVLAVPDDNPASLASFDDLAAAFEDPGFIFAMGGESVPVGAYTQKILASLGLDEAALEGQITYGEDVKGVTSVVKEGSAQAGVIYATDAFSAALTTVDEATEEMTGGKVEYPAALINTGANPDAGAAFLEFIQGPEASACFEAVGFTTLN